MLNFLTIKFVGIFFFLMSFDPGLHPSFSVEAVRLARTCQPRGQIGRDRETQHCGPPKRARPPRTREHSTTIARALGTGKRFHRDSATTHDTPRHARRNRK